MTDSASTKPRWVHRIKWTQTDGTEREHAYIRDTFGSVDELEAVGHEALQVAAEWRQEIAERVPTPPAHKVFSFYRYGGDTKIATWVEHPWALVRVGRGTSVAFLVKEQSNSGSFQAWIVVGEKQADGSLRWKCRFDYATTINRSDLLHVFLCALPWSPSQGDLEHARAETQRGAA
jgi:hypothetical protein